MGRKVRWGIIVWAISPVIFIKGTFFTGQREAEIMLLPQGTLKKPKYFQEEIPGRNAFGSYKELLRNAKK